ncbi:hypothetical protein GQF61_04810 [Sphingobacterium sp. DK4209]|uniref:Uncharacterized protein n=1 Tax=Sphingobacterium zhuxiongii TaxID=2662364 RepID=A0A5Q0QFV9_9SPHI|nr:MULTISPECIES: hypothetical protein [unclassified Sphingobacterium]MVZ65163.1 hypothetical protein [Sphingobacterium sp. DK4209]QGA26110.1 hypothetical protein GFH32_07140 [Sphingobacterium sp. dk4302]
MQLLIKKLEKDKKLGEKASKYTQIIDDKSVSHGVLFFIPMDKFEAKVLVPAPFHENLFLNGDPTYKQVLNHKEAMMLK